MSDSEMYEALHPDPTKKGARVTKATYDAYRAAFLQVVPKDEQGIELQPLIDGIVPLLPPDVRDSTSPGWWMMSVKLDLEARGVIERVPGKGKQRVRQK
ncbi:MAG: hypothetical protein KF753_23435 [Caldilineaceae bacterium]|nr:hypothetical protein [Caldilineaceae bacterium]